MKPKDKIFNFGLKAGLHALQPDIASIQIDGADVQNIYVNNGVGYSAGFQIRVNVERFFIQPAASWNFSKADILFDIVNPSGTLPQSMTMQIKSLEVPVVIGYHLVKERPYVLSIMGGAKIKYDYSTRYTSNTGLAFNYEEDSSPYHLSAYTAMEVFIGKLTFGIGYEYGLNKLRSDFNSVSYEGNDEQAEALPSMQIKKRHNGLNLSIGIMF